MRSKIEANEYKELFTSTPGKGTGDDIPYDLVGYITTIDTEKIDSDYMNSKFEKYLKELNSDATDTDAIHKAEEELHKTFATLSQEEQKYANIFLHDIQSGDAVIEAGKTFRDYVIEYVGRSKDEQMRCFGILSCKEDLILICRRSIDERRG